MDTPRRTNRNKWIPEDDLCMIMDELGAEDWCITELALLTGYRIDDIIRSRRDQWSGQEITLEEAKTGKSRTKTIDHPIRAVLNKLEKLTEPRANGYLCPSRRQRRGDGPTMSRTTLWRAWRRALFYAKQQGKGYTIHSLRRCYAVRLWRESGSLEKVQLDLGHDRPTTTMIYLRDAMDELIRACNTFGTVARGEKT